MIYLALSGFCTKIKFSNNIVVTWDILGKIYSYYCISQRCFCVHLRNQSTALCAVYLNQYRGCVIIREIDFLLKICWSIPCLHPSWRVLTWMSQSYVVNWVIVQFSWSDKLLTAVDDMLQGLKFTILFIIADIFWVKEQEQEGQKTEQQKIHSPFFFHSPLQIFHSPWGEPFTQLGSTGISHCYSMWQTVHQCGHHIILQDVSLPNCVSRWRWN